MKKKSKIGFGRSENTAPSIKTIDVVGWLLASVACGALAFFLTLHLLWRELSGPLSVHLLFLFKACVHALFPNLYAREAAYYETAVLHWDATGELSAMILRIAVSALVAFLPGVLMARRFLTPRDGLIYLRGPVRLSGRRAVACLRKLLERENKQRPDHDLAPGVPYPGSRWTQHTLLAGSTGAGKTTFLKPLVKSIFDADEQLILFDPKGEFTKAFDGASILAPWDARTCSWDIGKDMRNTADMLRFATAMVKESKDPMWSNAARIMVVGFMSHLRKTRGSAWGWREFADMFLTPVGDLPSMMRDAYEPAVALIRDMNITTQGILINLASYCPIIYALADAWEHVPESRRISFVDWTLAKPIKWPQDMPNRHRQIILQGDGAYPDLTSAFIEGIVGVISSLVNGSSMPDDQDRKIWFVADEAARMGKVPLDVLFSMSRSRGVRMVMACQDFVQLEKVHGKETVRAWLSMTGTLLIGKMGQGETADTLAKAIGSREVERRNVSSNGGADSSVSHVREEIQLYKPSEFGSRLGVTQKRDGVIMIAVIDGDAYELFLPFVDFPDKQEAHVPAEWTLGGATASPKMLSVSVASENADARRGVPDDGMSSQKLDSILNPGSSGLHAEEWMDPLTKILLGAGFDGPVGTPGKPKFFRPKL